MSDAHCCPGARRHAHGDRNAAAESAEGLPGAAGPGDLHRLAEQPAAAAPAGLHRGESAVREGHSAVTRHAVGEGVPGVPGHDGGDSVQQHAAAGEVLLGVPVHGGTIREE